jgi:hypothetical protein
MRIGRDDNLTIAHLRNDLFGPGRFDMPFVHGFHRLGLEVHPVCDVVAINVCPEVNETRELCGSIGAPSGTDVPRPGDYGYPSLPNISLSTPESGDPTPAGGNPSTAAQTGAAGGLIDVMA